jgi:hypothetical protein
MGLVETLAEGIFLREAGKLCQHLTPQVLEHMARKGQRVETLMQQIGQKFPPYRRNRGVDYLLSLSDAQLLTLLDRKLPEHVKVLRANPSFSADFINDLRRLAGAAQKK